MRSRLGSSDWLWFRGPLAWLANGLQYAADLFRKEQMRRLFGDQGSSDGS
jgi:hypothetical protein